MSTDEQALAALDLPDEVHAQVLRTVAAANSSHYVATSLWTDRPATHCPRCAQNVPQDTSAEVPVALSSTHTPTEVEYLDARHYCGAEIGPPEGHTYQEPGTAAWHAAVGALIRDLSGQLADRRAELTVRVERSVRDELSEALSRLADGATTEDVTTGTDLDPGVYHDGTQWVAWDWDPTTRGDIIQVTASDLTET